MNPMNKISQEEHVAYSIAMGVTLGHGLLYCTANSLISKSDSTKYWAIIIAQTDRYLGDNPDSQRNFRKILRNEIQDSEVLYAFDSAINAGGLDILSQDQKEFPLLKIPKDWRVVLPKGISWTSKRTHTGKPVN